MFGSNESCIFGAWPSNSILSHRKENVYQTAKDTKSKRKEAATAPKFPFFRLRSYLAELPFEADFDEVLFDFVAPAPVFELFDDFALEVVDLPFNFVPDADADPTDFDDPLPRLAVLPDVVPDVDRPLVDAAFFPSERVLPDALSSLLGLNRPVTASIMRVNIP